MAGPRRRAPTSSGTSTRLHPALSAAIGGGVVAAIIAIWWAIAAIEVVPRLFVPHPLQVVEAFIEVATEGYRGGTLWFHLSDSLMRVFLGFALAVITAVPLGLAMGHNRYVFAALDPILQFYRPLPPLAYYTILIVWLGIDDESKIALLYLAAFPPQAISASTAVRNVSEEKIHAARSLGAGDRQVMWRVIFPACLPQIFTGMRVSIGFTYTTLVASEIVAAQSGIGWMVLDAGNFLRSDIIFMGILVMGFTGILLDRAIVLLERKVVPWTGKDE
jgi:taurine transport system permease protein